MKTVTWNTRDGREATVTIELKTTKTINADGHKVAVKCCEVEIFASVEGMGTIGSGYPRKVDVPGVAAAIGNLGLPQERLDAVNEVIAEIESTPEWQAKIAAEEQAYKEASEYEAHAAKMRKIWGD